MGKLSFQHKIFWYFTLIISVIGIFAILVGGFHIVQTVFQEAKDRVAIDLRIAHNFLNQKLEKSVITLNLLADKQRLIDSLKKSQSISPDIKFWLERKRIESGFDVLTLCDKEGKVILRTRPPYYSGDSCLSNPLILKALQGKSVSGIVIVSSQKLKMEGEGLAEQAYIPFVSTPRAKPRPEKAETSGMFLMAAVPVWSLSGKIIGVLYGGALLNRNYQLVDYIRAVSYTHLTLPTN